MAGQIELDCAFGFHFLFALVTVMGFLAARWKAGPVSEHLTNGGSAAGSSVPGSPGSWSVATSIPHTP